MKVSRKVMIKHPKGLHIRPVTAIVKFLTPCKSSVYFISQKTIVNAKSILCLLSLAATYNSFIQIQADGEDAEEVVEKLLSSFQDVFGVTE